MHNGPRSVLITGAAGTVGRLLTSGWTDRYRLSLTDIRALDRRSALTFTQVDAASFKDIRGLCTGVDTVVHLAGLPMPQTAWPEIRRHNVRTFRTALRAARDAGCRRFIFASSAMIDIEPELPYSQGKRFCERLGERYAAADGLTVVCLRLGWVIHPLHRGLWPTSRHLPYVLIDQDALQAFTLAVEAPLPPFSIFTVVSANRRTHVDTTVSNLQLGFRPGCDSFELADRRYRSLFGHLKRVKLWMQKHL